MGYMGECHAITKILLILREITKKISKNFQLQKSQKNREILPKVIKITKSGHSAGPRRFHARVARMTSEVYKCFKLDYNCREPP